jgi:hypothetical protein
LGKTKMNLRLVSSGGDHVLAIKDHLLPLLRECGTLEYERDVARLITSSATSTTQMPPLWHLGIDDTVELARAKRGVEPFWIVVMGQGHGAGIDPLMVTVGGGMLEPMPAQF